MAYIKSAQHFINYLNSVLRKHPVEDIYNAEAYIELIYNKGLADQYSWDVRNDPSLISKQGVMKWLQGNALQRPLRNYFFRHIPTPEFLEVIEALEGLPGVYSFWNSADSPLYVGMSANLGSRIPTSFERFRKLDDQIFLRYIRTNSASDAALLEVYYIARLKPPLNALGNYPDVLTLQLQHVPEFGEAIPCNTIEQGEGNDG